ncbi:MAG: DNA mismatch repair endonuclease MutL [Deltaproteobacteria bacterium]|nr:MAG: DNA mismatch repair endonuclease MutL [Deltaproteobacteria bacterium]
MCNKIAAGEVVERPASVVKELVENSLDAGAGEISIEIEKGGRKLIRITDDGCGMGKEDIFLCLERHATSKIASDDDLFRLKTLGFRGEALPSIASVARMSLRSRPVEADEGMELLVDCGQIRRTGSCGMAVGTSIEVRDLFYRLPARRKFLRRDETELAHIGDVVTKMALAHPHVQFRLLHQGRRLVDVRRNEDLRTRVAGLLGRQVAGQLIELESSGPDGRVHGLVAPPELSRATTGSIFTFVNGRAIRDKVVQHAVMDAYRTLMPRGRYPVLVLFLELDPSEVDVNVHPTKHEVRFRRQGQVHDFITASLRQALRDSSWLEVPIEKADSSASGVEPAGHASAGEPAADSHRSSIQESLERYASRQEPGGVRQPFVPSTGPVLSHQPAEPVGSQSPDFAEMLPEKSDDGREAAGFFSGLRYLGQYHDSYLLCQDGEDLVIIDQHAAHERIGFEQLKQGWLSGRVESQNLLFPPVMEFRRSETAVVEEHLENFSRFGFELEPFGGTSWVLKAIPQILARDNAEALVRDVVDELSSLGRSSRLEDAVDKVLVTMACHSMVRANQSLAPEQVRALLDQLDRIDFSAQCPHGRPVMHRFSLGEVERLFHRT